jgi:hypothetical protein
MMAAHNGRTESTQLLIKIGANIEEQTHRKMQRNLGNVWAAIRRTKRICLGCVVLTFGGQQSAQQRKNTAFVGRAVLLAPRTRTEFGLCGAVVSAQFEFSGTEKYVVDDGTTAFGLHILHHRSKVV